MKKIVVILLLCLCIVPVFAFDEYYVSRVYCESSLSCDCIVINNNGEIEKHPDRILYPARLRKGTYTVSLTSLVGGMVEVGPDVCAEIIPFIDSLSSTQGILIVDSEITDTTFSAKLLIPEGNTSSAEVRPIFLNDVVFLDDLWKEELKNSVSTE